MPEYEVERCSAASSARGESMAGTATVVSNWLLLEHPGPWGRDALRETPLPPGVGERLRARSEAAGVRVQLIRPPDRSMGSRTACFAIHSGPGAPWLERISLDGPADVAELDLERLGRSEPLEVGEPEAGPLFLVCTNGRRDPCCAERGRPLAAALVEVFPGRTWETTHLGGHRFAGNLVAFPLGYGFGRVGVADGPAIARAYVEGVLDLEHLRGRSCLSAPVQAAEHLLRRREGLGRIEELELEDESATEREAVVRFGTSAGRFEVRLALERSEPVPVSCHADPEPVTVYRELAITRRQ